MNKRVSSRSLGLALSMLLVGGGCGSDTTGTRSPSPWFFAGAGGVGGQGDPGGAGSPSFAGGAGTSQGGNSSGKGGSGHLFGGGSPGGTGGSDGDGGAAGSTAGSAAGSNPTQSGGAGQGGGSGTTVCASDQACIEEFGDDPCKVNPRCDDATATCIYDALDKDGDGFAPLVCGGEDCDDSNALVAPSAQETCDGKDNNCDGQIDESATCPGGGSCQQGACVCPPANLCAGACVDLEKDPAHCGSCGKACPAGVACSGGLCECPAGQVACGADCRNLQNDFANCGACGKSCAGGETCAGGLCSCPAGETLCSGSCTDLQSDPGNCGACGKTCAGICQGGVCNTCSDVDLFLLMDLSGSMGNTVGASGTPTRLDIARSGALSFLSSGSSAGLHVGLGYFPYYPPEPPSCASDADCNGGDCFLGTCFSIGISCLLSDYPAAKIAPLTLPGGYQTLASSLQQQSANGGTPSSALNGTLSYMKSFALAHPGHKVAVVYVGDGFPNNCTPDADKPDSWIPTVASYAKGSPKVPTYFVEIDDEVQSGFSSLAAAAGTPLHVALSSSEVYSALTTIRNQLKACP